MMENENMVVPSKSPRRRGTMVLGAAFLLFALIGVITVITLLVGWIGRLLDNPTQKQELASFIRPVAMFDPVPFTSIDQADMNMVLQSSIWSALLTDGRQDKYSYDDMGRLILPATDVDAACARLFGPNIELTHTTFGDLEMTYLYDSDLKSYLVPVSGFLAAYTPQVVEIENEGDTLVLTVGYLPSGTMWSADLNGNVYEPDPDKYMLYILQETENGSYYISSIQDVPADSEYAMPTHGIQQSSSSSSSSSASQLENGLAA